MYIKTPEHRLKLRLANLGKKQSKETIAKRVLKLKGRIFSEEHKRKISEAQKGEKGNNWKGDRITYNTLHWWLRRIYGSANKCENLKCKKESKWYVWAKLKDKKYERKRENFWQLCRKCH